MPQLQPGLAYSHAFAATEQMLARLSLLQDMTAGILESREANALSADAASMKQLKGKAQLASTRKQVQAFADLPTLYKLFKLINTYGNNSIRIHSDSCGIAEDRRIDCGSPETTEETCLAQGCCYAVPEHNHYAPWCYHTKESEFFRRDKDIVVRNSDLQAPPLNF